MLARNLTLGMLVVAITLTATPTASAQVDYSSALIKILTPIIQRELSEALKDIARVPDPPARKVQVGPTVGENQLILGRKTFDVQTGHYQSYAGNAETVVKLVSTVPCEGLYGIKVSAVQCSLQATPGFILVQVTLPRVGLYKLVLNYEKQEKVIRSGFTPQWFVQGTIRRLEAEIPAAVTMVGTWTGESFLDEVNAVARVQFQKALETHLNKSRLPAGPSFYVIVR